MASAEREVFSAPSSLMQRICEGFVFVDNPSGKRDASLAALQCLETV